MRKNKLKLTVDIFQKTLPDYKNSETPKEKLTAEWLSDHIKNLKAKGLIKSGDILPSKKELADYLGISPGTVQNAIKYLEDENILESKQRTGTYIACNNEKAQKQTSKRELAVYAIEKYLNGQKQGNIMPPISKMSEMINIAKNTVRLAYIYLERKNIISVSKKQGKTIFKIVNIPEVTDDKTIKNHFLTNKISDEILKYIKENFNNGDKIPTRDELAKIFNVSPKTIHDALKILEEKGIILSRRGKYGTLLLNKEGTILQPQREYSIFTKAKFAVRYRWEETEKKLKNLIKDTCVTGSKLPSVAALSEIFNVSTNTIRQALQNLEKQHIVEFKRGRYGGTFVINIIDSTEQSKYEWVAVSQNFTGQKSSN